MKDTSSNQLITSSGASIKIWSPPHYELSRELVPPHPHDVSNICYDHINTRLLSSNVAGQGLLVTTLADDKSVLLTPDISSCVIDISHNCKYVVGGSIDGKTTLLDVKNSKIKQTYSEHKSKVTAIKISSKSISSAASGDESGVLVTYNVANGRSNKVSQAELSSISSLAFSHFKHAFLGSGHLNGNIGLWDITVGKQHASFTGIHEDEVSCLSFSPINDMLLLAASRDSSISYLDVNSKSLVKRLPTDASVTQCVLMQDGHTSAVSTDQGLVLLYDLRKFGPPFCYFTAHNNSRISHLSQIGPPSFGRSSSRPSSMVIDQGFTTSSTDSDIVDFTDGTPAFSHSQKSVLQPTRPLAFNSVFSPLEPASSTVPRPGLSALGSPLAPLPKTRLLSSPDEASLTTVSESLTTQKPPVLVHSSSQTDAPVYPNGETSSSYHSGSNLINNGTAAMVNGATGTSNYAELQNNSGTSVEIIRKTVLESCDKLDERLHRDIVSVNMNTYKDFFQLKQMMQQVLQETQAMRQEINELRTSVNDMQERRNFFLPS